jgi:ribosomal protein L11 methyltransferase
MNHLFKKNPVRWYEVTLLVPTVWQEILPDALERMGFSGIWVDEEKKPPYRAVLKAYLSDTAWRDETAQEIAGHLEHISRAFSNGVDRGEFTFRVIEEEDWASKWLPFFTPIRIGPVWIRPIEKEVGLLAGEKEIVINPGQAFGTGHHETTRLCLEALLRCCDRLKKDVPILDFGTGSGILAMFAAKLGFTNILALDNDPVAVETAKENLAANGFDQGADGAVHVDLQPISAVTKQFSIRVANVTSRDLTALAPLLVQRIAGEGKLILSGILGTEADTVAQAYRRESTKLVEQHTRGEWVCMVFKKLNL